MKTLLRILLLAVCGGISLLGAMIITSLWAVAVYSRNIDLWSWAAFLESVSIFVMGAIICLIFGTPFLFLIDKYFNQFRARYIVGGAIAAWVAWLVIMGPLLVPSIWLEPKLWRLLSSMVYAGNGFATGLLFTLLLSAIERCKKWRELRRNREVVKSAT